jgi:NAD(P)-dependent dehydrogenase (short-subunit alcohol dehydrogenase family)
MSQSRQFTLVTGASSGIGEAVARRMACSGPLILHGRDPDRLEAVRLSLPRPETHRIWCQDFADGPSTVESLAQMLAELAVPVSAFIHCAAELHVAPVTGTDSAGVLRAFQVNYFSATAILRLLLKKAINLGSLRTVVFVSSISSSFGSRGSSVYAATKGALDSLARSLATELAPVVRVNSILPGAIQTPGTQFLYASQGTEKLAEGYLLGQGCTSDIAAMAEFLVSDRSRWITGQQFVVDGGKTAH